MAFGIVCSSFVKKQTKVNKQKLRIKTIKTNVYLAFIFKEKQKITVNVGNKLHSHINELVRRFKARKYFKIVA